MHGAVEGPHGLLSFGATRLGATFFSGDLLAVALSVSFGVKDSDAGGERDAPPPTRCEIPNLRAKEGT